MAFVKQVAGMTALGGALLLGIGLAAPAHAGYVVTLTQQGSNVVATGSGSLDLTDLSFFASGTAVAGIEPNTADITTGPTSASADAYSGFTGPPDFGNGGITFADAGNGDTVSIIEAQNLVIVPQGYVSGDPLSSMSTYDNQTFASLEAVPGTYVWTWGSGADADSFTLQIGPAVAVHEPSSIAFLTLPLGLVMWLVARRTRPAPGSR